MRDYICDDTTIRYLHEAKRIAVYVYIMRVTVFDVIKAFKKKIFDIKKVIRERKNKKK